MDRESQELFGPLIEYGLIKVSGEMVSLTNTGVKFAELQAKGYIKVIDNAIATNMVANKILEDHNFNNLKQVIEFLHRKLLTN